MAEELVAQGKVEAAKRVLSLVVPPDPEAVAALDLAKLLENNGQLEQAVDAYLKTYRISPALLDDEHLPTRLMRSDARSFSARRCIALTDFAKSPRRTLRQIQDVIETKMQRSC